jgi:hypothetical protein
LAIPPIKWNGNCIHVGTTNRKPPGPISVIDQSEILTRSQVQFITISSGAAQLCWAITSHCTLHEFGAEKPIFWAKPEHFDFFAINCRV